LLIAGSTSSSLDQTITVQRLLILANIFLHEIN